MKNIKLTVALPMYRTKHIAWCVMESLCEQKNIDFEWEIVVAEEIEPLSFGEKNILSYVERLKKVGCVRIKYIPLGSWIPLAMKWKLIAQHSSDTDIFLLQAADFYNSPKRLKNTYDIYQETRANWIKCDTNLIYDLNTGKIHTCIGGKSGSDMAFETKNAKKLPESKRKRGIDHWLRESIELMVGEKFKVAIDNSDSWQYSINIHGLNNLSRRDFRRELFTQEMQYINNIPQGVLNKLNSLRELAGTIPLLPKKKKKKKKKK